MHACKGRKDLGELNHDQGTSNSQSEPQIGNFLKSKLADLEEATGGSQQAWKSFFTPRTRKSSHSNEQGDSRDKGMAVVDVFTRIMMEATSQLGSGSLRKSVKILESNGVAGDSEAVRERLRELHPRARGPIGVDDPGNLPRIAVTTKELQAAFRELPNDAGAGISGDHQHAPQADGWSSARRIYPP